MAILLGAEVFLFLLGAVWIGFATVQDLKMREVANWLSLTLPVFAMVFRLSYSYFSGEWGFFIAGIAGVAVFFILSTGFYYSRVFAGGDAKLLIGVGAVLPWRFEIFPDLVILGGFLFLFLLAGAFYSMAYSLVVVSKDKGRFFAEVKKQSRIYKNYLLLGIGVFVFGMIFALWFFDLIFAYFPALGIVFPLLYVYSKAVEESFFVKSIETRKLTEGDWLYEDVKVRNKVIKSDWQGLGSEEIQLLRKHKKQILIKEGIPFVPAFLIGYVGFFAVYVFLF